MTPRQVLELTAAYYDAPRAPEELLTLLDLVDVRARRGDVSAAVNSSEPYWHSRCSDDRGSSCWMSRPRPSIPKGAKSFAISSRPNATADVRCW